MTTIPITTGELVDTTWLNQVTIGRYRKTSSKQVVNTITTTDLLNGEITIAAGALSTNRALRLTAYGDWVNDTGSTQDSPQFDLRLPPSSDPTGGTIFGTGTTSTVWVASASRMGWRIQAEIANLGAANSQWSSLLYEGSGFFNAILAAFATGNGQVYASGGGGTVRGVAGAANAIDTTVGLDLILAVTLPVASASLDVTLKGALVEIV